MLSLPRATSAALLLASAVTASVALASPASANVTGGTSTSDVVLYAHCQTHDISYGLAVDPGTALWRLEVQVADPSGFLSEGTVVNSATNPATSGTIPVTFCGSEPIGTYTVRATGFYEVVPAVHIPFTLPETTFQVRPTATRTALKEKSLGHGRHRLTAKVLEQDEHGYERADGLPVELQKRVHGQWHRVRGLTLTTVHGAAVATVGARGTYRAVVPAEGNHGASASAPVTL